ncbi:MAG: PaaI family thioesterase [Lautropia sp.]
MHERDLLGLDPAFFPPALMQAIGFDAVLRTDPAGLAVVRYVARPEQAHSDGRIVQGGFITAWLDHSMAIAIRVRDADAALASLDINVSFLERVAPQPVVVEARVVRWGGRIAFLHAELRADTGEPGPVLARATSTGMILRPSRG